MAILNSCKGSSYGEEGNSGGGGIRVFISFGGRNGTFPLFGGSRCGSRCRCGGGGARSGLSALAGTFPAACCGLTIATTHHTAEPAHYLVRSALPGVEPRKVILV
jgi:hypothetical protein